MDIEVLKILISVISMLGCGGIVGGIVNRHLVKRENKREEERRIEAEKKAELLRQEEEKRKAEDAYMQLIGQACKILLRSEVYRIGEVVEMRGWFTLREKTDFSEAFAAYSALNGNHQTEDYYNYVCSAYKVRNDD